MFEWGLLGRNPILATTRLPSRDGQHCVITASRELFRSQLIYSFVLIPTKVLVGRCIHPFPHSESLCMFGVNWRFDQKMRPVMSGSAPVNYSPVVPHCPYTPVVDIGTCIPLPFLGACLANVSCCEWLGACVTPTPSMGKA